MQAFLRPLKCIRKNVKLQKIFLRLSKVTLKKNFRITFNRVEIRQPKTSYSSHGYLKKKLPRKMLEQYIKWFLIE